MLLPDIVDLAFEGKKKVFFQVKLNKNYINHHRSVCAVLKQKQSFFDLFMSEKEQHQFTST